MERVKVILCKKVKVQRLLYFDIKRSKVIGFNPLLRGVHLNVLFLHCYKKVKVQISKVAMNVNFIFI